jgi:hypothetical protein
LVQRSVKVKTSVNNAERLHFPAHSSGNASLAAQDRWKTPQFHRPSLGCSAKTGPHPAAQPALAALGKSHLPPNRCNQRFLSPLGASQLVWDKSDGLPVLQPFPTVLEFFFAIRRQLRYSK